MVILLNQAPAKGVYRRWLLAAELRDVVLNALDDIKGKDIVPLDVSTITDFTDCMIIVTGTSSTHVRALVRHVVNAAKARGREPIGVEGETTAEWVLVDLGEVVLHVMQASTRDYYDLERLWSSPVAAVRSGA